MFRGQGTGGSGGVGPPLELEIYIVEISKIRKIIFFISIGPPLGKNRSLAPEHVSNSFCLDKNDM